MGMGVGDGTCVVVGARVGVGGIEVGGTAVAVNVGARVGVLVAG